MPAGLKKLGEGRFAGPADELSYKGGSGRLTLRAVHPDDMRLHLFGGLGKAASWVNGKNYPAKKTGAIADPWPAEINAPQPPKVAALSSPQEEVVGMVIDDDIWPRVLAVKLGAPMKAGELIYHYPVGKSRHLVVGLAPQAGFTIKLEAGRVIITKGGDLKSTGAGLLAFVVEPKEAEKKSQ